MKIKILIPFVSIIMMSLYIFIGEAYSQNKIDKGAYFDIPKKGFVPDKETAIKIAEAIWTPVYGQEEVKKGRPFTVELRDSTNWIIVGHLDKANGEIGNQLYIEFQKSDCKIVGMALWK